MELILEIGTEEIPSGYLYDGLRQLKDIAVDTFKRNRISFDEVITYGTPRRLVLIVKGLSEKQEDSLQEIKGPPRNVSFDKDGKPTKAAISFAQKYNVAIDEISIIETPKGEYLFIKRVIEGNSTSEILREEIPNIISSISWPKSMRWADISFQFVRPIHWILCLLDGNVIPFEVARIHSGKETRGHRFMSPKSIFINGVEDYLRKIRDAKVIVDPEERKKMVMDEVMRAVSEVGGLPEEDPALLDTVTNLVEYPFAVLGEFEHRFLELPVPVIITPMKEHQKYFPVYDKEGNLMPHFVAINNTIPKDPDLVKRGHERVLRARLADAEFFFEEDQKKPLLERLEELKGVVYHAELGTSYEKVERFTKLAEYICNLICPEKVEDVRLVCRLCKCDLVTLMVSEFPDLQGIMGREYAMIEGYPDEICNAIYEHYLPVGSFGKLPGSKLGAIVGIADRMDTICGYFAIGIRPSGSADPFGLRRHAIAIIRIIEAMGWDISLKGLISEALSTLRDRVRVPEGVEEDILLFFKDRYRFMLLREGLPADVVDAVLSVSFDVLKGLRDRIRQLKEFIDKTEGFEELVLTAKRVSNILKKQKDRYKVDTSLLKEPQEERLWNIYLSVSKKLSQLIGEEDFFGALRELKDIKRPVDDFFDNVEIMTKESDALRRNRIALVQKIESLFKKVADFSKFSY